MLQVPKGGMPQKDDGSIHYLYKCAHICMPTWTSGKGGVYLRVTATKPRRGLLNKEAVHFQCRPGQNLNVKKTGAGNGLTPRRDLDGWEGGRSPILTQMLG